LQTIQEISAKVNQQATAGLARIVRAMPADKQIWKPLDHGRNVLDQAKECAAINLITAGILRSRALPEDFSAEYGKYCAGAETTDDILDLLAQSGEALASAISDFPDSDLDQTLTLPWDDKPSTFAEVMIMPYWNTAYHIGQACYIQTLYGDNEMH
jgi:hypothetical protein